MTNAKTTKRALLSSALALFLCFAMLIGTTFAWFTDKVESKNNIIKAGNLDIELKYAKIDGDKLTDWDTVGGKDNIFDKNALWEPGRVEVVYLEVSNLGSLALKYQLGVNVVNEITGKNVAGEDFKLSDHLVFKVVKLDAKPATPYTREEAIAAAGTTKGLKDYNGATTPLEVGGTDYVALIVYMPETVGNEANYRGDAVPTIELGINLYATQQAAEQDSFGSDYDEDAWGEGFKVTTAGDLQAAINNGVTNIVLTENITLSESIVIPAPGATTVNVATTAEANTNAVVIDLNGKEITGNVGRDADGNRVHVIVNNGNAVIKNGVITSAGVNGGSAIYNADGATLTVENVTLNGAPQEGSTWPSYTVNNYGTLTVSDSSIYGVQGIIATNNTANTTVNNVIAYRDGWSSGHVFYNSSTAKVTINGGTYTNDGNGVDGTMIYGGETVVNGGTFIVKEGAYFALCSGSKLTVNGGDFSNIKSCIAWGGAMTISGGTFGFNPTTYVADGFKAVSNNGKYVVVADGVDHVVTTPAELASAIVDGGEVYIATDLDMNNAWTSVVPTNGLTILGNGYTITNLNLPLLAGKAGPKVTIKGLTIADSKVGIAANENGLGSGAFIAWADWGGSVVFEDCHLLNSTVTGNERAAAFIGYSMADVTIKNCSVEGSIIEAVGSTAGLIGHANGITTIDNSSVTNTKVTSTEDRTGKTALAGSLIGTVNNTTALTKVIASNNTTSNNGATPVSAEIGRIVTGTLTIDGKTVAFSVSTLDSALASGGDVVLSGNMNFNSSETTANSGYGATGVSVKGSVLDGNGYSLGINNWGTWDSAVHTTGGTIKNLTINSGMRGIFMGSATADVYIDNVIIDGTVYTFNSDGGSKDYGVYISNSTLNGWTSHSDVHKEVVYTNCNFGEGNGYAYCRPYGPTTFKNCAFEAGFAVEAIGEVTFENCTIGGEPLTAENLATLVTSGTIDNVTVK